MTVKISFPVPVPEILSPIVKLVPFLEILVGVALFSVARPPEILKTKSSTSRSPFPLLALKTISEKVTVAVLLSFASTTLDIVGASLSINVLLLMPCEVIATFPDPSKMASAVGEIVNTSAPVGVPFRPIPREYTLLVLLTVVGFA